MRHKAISLLWASAASYIYNNSYVFYIQRSQ